MNETSKTAAVMKAKELCEKPKELYERALRQLSAGSKAIRSARQKPIFQRKPVAAASPAETEERALKEAADALRALWRTPGIKTSF